MKIETPNCFKLRQQTKVESSLSRSEQSMVRQFRHFLSISLCFLASLLLSSCAIDVDNDIKWRDEVNNFKSLWSFDNPSDYTYDENQVEIKNGKAMLKEVDQFHSGSDFSKGTHVGTSVSGANISLLEAPPLLETHVNTILQEKSSNLISYWRMEGQFVDESSYGNNGIPQGEANASAPGQIGSYSALFDGTGDNVLVGDNSIFDSPFTNQKIAASVWVKTSVNGNLIFGGYSLNPPYPGFGLGVGAGGGAGKLTFWTGTSWKSSLTTIGDGSWHHIVYSQTGTNYTIYVDGALDSTGTTDALLSFSGNRVIGSHTNQSSSFDGNIDEFALWNSDLTATQAQQLYEGQIKNFTELSSSWTPHYDKLVGYWKMDGNWQDSSGQGNHATVSGAATFSSGKVGSQSGSFDGGVNSYVYAPSSPELQLNSLTGAAWFNRVADSNGAYTYSNILSKGNNDGAGQNQNYSLLLPDGSSPLYVRIGKVGFTSLDCTGGKPIPVNSGWQHGAFTVDYDGANIKVKIYLNGELDRECTQAGQPFSTASGDFSIGSWKTSANPLGSYGNFAGHIDGVGIWNLPLKGEQISTIYHRQKQKYSGQYSSPVIDLGVSGNWASLVSKTSLPFHKELPGSQSESSSDYSNANSELNRDLLGYWNFNESSLNSYAANDFFDLSGQTHHGAEVNGVLPGQKGLQNTSIEFIEGSNSYFEVGDFQVGNTISVAMWINPKEFSKNFGQTLIAKHDLLGNNFLVIGCFTDRYHVRVRGDYFEDVSCIDSGWQHIAVVISNIDGSSSRVKFFLNGTTIWDQTLSQVLGSVSPGYPWVFGQEWDASTESDFYFGKMDEAALWGRALTDSEVQQLYRRGANRIKYQLKSCVDSSCNCKSFSTTPAGSINDCDGDGTPNSSDTDDVHLAEFMGPGGNGGTYFSELFNRQTSDITFTCSANTTDSDANVCVDDEITLAGSPKATAPSFTFADFPASARPVDNRYFQYRVIMEAEENTACNGEPCLPELESIEIGPTGRYFGGNPSVVNKTPFPYEASLKSLYESSGGSCTTSYQISNDGTNFYYWDGSAWVTGSDVTQANDLPTLNNNIESFTSSVGFGNFFFRTYLGTSNTSNSCEVDELEIKRNRK